MDESKKDRENVPVTIPYILYEYEVDRTDAREKSDKERAERREKRHWWFTGILLALFVLSNIFWIIREMSYEDVSSYESTQIEASQDGNGNNYAVGGDVVGTNSEDNQNESD